MQLITVNEENCDKIAAVDISNTYDDVFAAYTIGTLGTPRHLKIKDSCSPNPISVRKKFKIELFRKEKLGIITPVDEPTPLASQLVIHLKKTGAVTVCIEPRELNNAFLHEHYTFPILDETLHEIQQYRVFSLADLSSGYWHVALDKESSLLTTVQTPFGRYRRCHLPFGTCASAEIFRKKLIDALERLPVVMCIAHDVLIHGKITIKIWSVSQTLPRDWNQVEKIKTATKIGQNRVQGSSLKIVLNLTLIRSKQQ
ncbi:hypothetical protein LSH36_1483g00008 [Paralvinella palmiformis]|uniref:Reverse transcriptase domain-containing protein n=1 Tax=Paralvinella palmiformis TaxID=53620 RepID=A0AAD9MQ75_9ANNE|nr:hypothetical protein LSH36_1483g00008 [Paralvinella palmiformis]